MKLRVGATCLLAFVCLTGCAGRLAMVGRDAAGRSTQAFVQEKKYIEHLSGALVDIEKSVIPAIKTRDDRGNWELSSVTIGFGAKAEAGIGPFKVGLKPRISVTFARGADPPLPKSETDGEATCVN